MSSIPGQLATVEFLKLAEKGDLEGVRKVVEGNSQRLFEKSPKQSNLLHKAAFSGNYELVCYLLDAGLITEINRKNKFGETPIVVASRRGNYDVAILLAKRGADPLIGAEEHQGKNALEFKAGTSTAYKGLTDKEIKGLSETADEYVKTRRRIPLTKPPETLWQKAIMCMNSMPTLG